MNSSITLDLADAYLEIAELEDQIIDIGQQRNRFARFINDLTSWGMPQVTAEDHDTVALAKGVVQIWELEND